MIVFSGAGADLAALLAYERSALEFVRATLFNQNEKASTSLTLKLSEAKDEQGFYPRHFGLSAEPIVAGADAVQAALSRLRPLAFSAAFKMQDMIVEWILHANGSTAWQFEKKIKSYDAMRSAGTLCQPLAFASQSIVSDAFWELYRKLTPFRSKIIHKNSFSLTGDTLTVTSDGKTLTLLDADQGSYIRAICLIADALVSSTQFDGAKAYIVENDLGRLSAVHKVSGLSSREIRTAFVDVVAPGQKGADGRIQGSVDFDEIKRNAEAAFPTCGILVFDLALVIEVDGFDRSGYFLQPRYQVELPL